MEAGPSSQGDQASAGAQAQAPGSFQPVFSRNIRREAHAVSAPPEQGRATNGQEQMGRPGSANQPIDDEMRNRAPGIANNFYERPISDFKRPYGGAEGPDAEGMGDPDAYGEPPPGSDPQSQQQAPSQQQQQHTPGQVGESAKSRLRPAELIRIAREEEARREAKASGPLQELLKTRKARKEAQMNKSRQQQKPWQKPPASQQGYGATGQPTQPRPGVKPLGPLAPKVYHHIHDQSIPSAQLRAPPYRYCAAPLAHCLTSPSLYCPTERWSWIRISGLLRHGRGLGLTGTCRRSRGGRTRRRGSKEGRRRSGASGQLNSFAWRARRT